MPEKQKRAERAEKILLAGATGVIGKRLVLLLRASNYRTFGTTRDEGKASWLRAQGAQAVVIDVFDRDALIARVGDIRPDVVISELTDLPRKVENGLTDEAKERNSRMWREGVANLIEAAQTAGTQRIIAQSYLPIYARSAGPHVETDDLDPSAQNAITVAAVTKMEDTLLHARGVNAIVLRYGNLYGPGTWSNASQAAGSVHVDAAAWAALLAVDRGEPGIYNICDDDGYASIGKARRELGWSPGFRLAPA